MLSWSSIQFPTACFSNIFVHNTASSPSSRLRFYCATAKCSSYFLIAFPANSTFDHSVSLELLPKTLLCLVTDLNKTKNSAMLGLQILVNHDVVGIARDLKGDKLRL